MEQEKLHYKIHISGRVQGVGYRWNAAYEARLRDIKGFVSNLPDGRVYIEAEGYRDQLEDYVKWCRKGPRASIVESIDIVASEPEGYTDFYIKH